MLSDRRRLQAFKALSDREQQAYEQALDALDNPQATDEERRERIKQFVEAGDELLTFATEVH
jgi:formiminotetrahydrofolate cyclodeaminase